MNVVWRSDLGRSVADREDVVVWIFVVTWINCGRTKRKEEIHGFLHDMHVVASTLG